MSEEKKPLNIHQRILLVMKDVAYVQKDPKKKVDNKYTFASHDAVVAAVRTSQLKHGIVVFPQNLEITEADIKYGWEYGKDRQKIEKKTITRTRADITWHFVNADDPQDFITVPTFGYGVDESDKGAGKAISYSKKYAILTVYMLETGDDPESSHNNQEEIDHEKWQQMVTNAEAGLVVAESEKEIDAVKDQVKPFFRSMPEWYQSRLTMYAKVARDRVKRNESDKEGGN